MEPKFITTGTKVLAKVLALLVPKMSFCHEAPGCRRRCCVREEWSLDARPQNQGAKRLDLLNFGFGDLAITFRPSQGGLQIQPTPVVLAGENNCGRPW